ncbi:MAG: hypothetical protein E7204_00685 [Veillonella sp.]|uniref:hypothetical protein n=1 Tax=Veillonella sp. TaxID=1926307 RepID=UPI0025E728B5|nr:hypothetical protein [Veillonella sp.]MBE6079362.1 hypothetical protein [Veillonella sp.]
MNSLVTRLLELAESMTKGTRKKIAEKPVTPEQQIEAEPCEASETDLYDHRIISVEEDAINRILKAQLRNHWLFYSVTFEFENNNKVYMGIITTLGTVINIEFTIEDFWFDDYASSFSIKLNMSDVDMGGFIMNTIVHLLGNWSLSLLGTFFNPFEIIGDGSTVRFEKKGIIRFDLSPDSPIRRLISWPNRCSNAKGPVILINARSEQSVLRLEYYAFRDEVETYNIPEVPVKTSWVRSIDLAAALLLPIGVWISFIILHHYLPAETIEFSFSTYFLISLGILCISFIVMNIPRYIYMYFDSRKKWQSVFVHNNIKIQMRKLQRRIQIQQVALKGNGKETDAESQANIRDLLLQIRDKRFLAQRLKIADEDRDRKQKIKFIIAYIVCTLLEWILLIH